MILPPNMTAELNFDRVQLFRELAAAETRLGSLLAQYMQGIQPAAKGRTTRQYACTKAVGRAVGVAKMFTDVGGHAQLAKPPS